jgi:nicotinamidase-related amidase
MNKALIVIDMQNGDKYTYEHLYKRKQVVKNILKLIDAFNDKNYSVIKTSMWITDKKKSPVYKKFPKIGIPKSKSAEMMDELKGKYYDLSIKKENWSGFYKTDLEAYLKKNRIKELYLTGIHAGCCVLFTGADAFYRGYKTYIVTDAVSSVTDKKGLEKKIEKFEELVGYSITTDSLLNELRKH